MLVITALALKYFSAITGVAFCRQEQSNGIVTIALEKGHAYQRTGITSD